MDFIVDKETKTVSITAEFDAERDLVWDAYTKPELLDQWWAPKPGHREQRLWNSERAGGDFMQWSAPKARSVGQSRNTLPSLQKPISKSLILSQTKTKILNCRVLIGTEFQRARRNDKGQYFYLQRIT